MAQSVRYGGDGRRKCPYEPKTICKRTIYGYATGVFSSRQIAKKAEEDAAARVLADNNFPDARTVNYVRKDSLNNFIGLIAQVIRIASRAGLVKLGIVAIYLPQ